MNGFNIISYFPGYDAHARKLAEMKGFNNVVVWDDFITKAEPRGGYVNAANWGLIAYEWFKDNFKEGEGVPALNGVTLLIVQVLVPSHRAPGHSIQYGYYRPVPSILLEHATERWLQYHLDMEDASACGFVNPQSRDKVSW